MRERAGAGGTVRIVAKVEEEVSTASREPGADDAGRLARYTGPPVPLPRPEGHFLRRFWHSAVGKKWVMALSGIVLLGYVLAHMVGNLKVFLGKDHINDYGEWLRTLGEPIFPRTVVLWGMRVGAHLRVRAPHHRGLPAHADEPEGPTGGLPVTA